MGSDAWAEKEYSIKYVIDQVAQRGWEDASLQIDNFAELVKDRKVREAQTVAMYEQYFLPKRHEFEWEVLNEIVEAVVESRSSEFVAAAMAGGVLGNAAYDVLRKLCLFAATTLKKTLGKGGFKIADSFRQIASDAETLKKVFEVTSKARIGQMEEATGLPREKIYPLMKLFGLKHYRRGTNHCYWQQSD